MIVPGMAVLPDRTYHIDSRLRRRYFVNAGNEGHPAKMNCRLLRDLVARYSRPGDRVVDLFGGIGTTLLAVLQGRDATVVELSAGFASLASANARKIVDVGGGVWSGRVGALGRPAVFRGNSRQAPFAPGAFDVCIMSPPYWNVASRNRSKEPHAQTLYAKAKAHPEWNGEWARVRTAASRGVDGYGAEPGQIGNVRDFDEHFKLIGDVYCEAHRVVKPGGTLVLVTGNCVRAGLVVDLAAATIAAAMLAGWTPVERWRHEKSYVSTWRHLHARLGQPVVTSEDVLVFAKGTPAYAYTDLPPTAALPVTAVFERARHREPSATQAPLDLSDV